MAGVKPFVETFASKNYIVTPKERVEKFLTESAKGKTLSNIFGTRVNASSTDLVTLNVKAHLSAVELKYPGDDYDLIVDKWLYVFHAKEKVFVADAYAYLKDGKDYVVLYRHHPPFPSGSWSGEGPPTEPDFVEFKWDPAKLSEGFPLPMKVSDSPGDFRLFVSPWRLPGAVLNALINTPKAIDEAFTPARAGLGPGLWGVAIDPFEWAAECKTQFYDPRLAELQDWLSDEEEQSKLYIASVLKSWIETDGDPLGIKNEVRSGEPYAFLNTWKKKELALRQAVEEAGAYLCETCLDAPEHKLVEKACMDGGVPGCEYAAMQWATVLCGLSQSGPGKRYQIALAADSNRYIAKQIFYEGSPYIAWSNFGANRWLWYSSWVSLGEMMGAWRTMKAKQAGLSLPLEEKLLVYFKEIGVKLTEDLNAKNTKIYKNLNNKLAEGRQLSQLTKRYRALAADLAREADAAIKLSADQGGVIKMEGPNIAATVVNKVFKTVHGERIVTAVGHIHTSVKVPLDVINVYLAVKAYQEAEPMQKNDKIVSIVGASADLASLMLEIGGPKATAKWGVKAAARKGVGGVLGFISGACDMYDMAGQAGTAYVRGTTGEVVGAAIGVAGGAIVALGGAVVAISAFAPGMFAAASVAGPFGWAAAAIGTALLLIGATIMYFFKLNPYEQFALHSFLGKKGYAGSPPSETQYFDWAPAGMPCSKAVTESKVLSVLLSNWQAKVVGSSTERKNGWKAGAAFLEIYPGLFDHSGEIAVEVVQNYGGRVFRCGFVMKENEDGVAVQGDLSLVLKFNEITTKRKDRLALEQIRVPLRPAMLVTPPANTPEMYEDVAESKYVLTAHKARVTFKSKANFNDPMGATYEIDILDDDGMSSLDTSKKAKP